MPFTKIAAAGIGSTGTVTLENLTITGVLDVPTITGAASTANVKTDSLVVSGVSTLGNTVVGGATTQLIVTGNARITGILTIGTSSVTLDGTNNQINVGTGVTIHHTNGVQVGGNTVHSTGLTVNQLNATGVSTFVGVSTFQSTLFANQLSVSGVTTVAAGSTAAPSISPTGDSNTGIFFPSADTVAFVEGGVEVLRINSSGNIGIGTTDSLNKFEVGNVSGGVTAPDFTISTVSLGSSITIGRLSSVGSDNTAFRVRDRVNRTLIYATVGGVDIGSTDVSTPLNIKNGNLVFSTAGTGIDFSATANSSGTMTSELLSDYEEGTWTPQIKPDGVSSGFTPWTSTSSGTYTKIGRTVHLKGTINYTAKTTTGNYAWMVGFPFYPATDSEYFFVTIKGAGAVFYQMRIVTAGNGHFIKDNTDGAYGPLTGSELGPSTGLFSFEFVYQV